MFVAAKELVPDSGGPGEFRGGLGQRIALRNDSGTPMQVACLAGRTEFAPAGMLGGRPGALRRVVINGRPVHAKGRYVLAANDELTTWEAGGGGLGDPGRRDRAALRRDVAMGFVSAGSAHRDYGSDEF
jgi:N-methylhydantoinase B